MKNTHPKVDEYLKSGCGRCPLGGTPQCKVNRWPEELKLLREIALACQLNEDLKWGVPCYTFNKKNIVIISAFKEYCSISFFKGALLNDVDRILEKPGENTQLARIVRFTDTKNIKKLATALKAYIEEAIALEQVGLKSDIQKPSTLSVPPEFQNKLDENPELKQAFDALTPGRQRSYLLHFTGAKQSKTRESRIEKCIPGIFSGKGFNERT